MAKLPELRHCTLLLLFLGLATGLMAQTTPAAPTTLDGWADRLTRFGRAVPQEKVFVHLDNTCYFLGDTIWFAAYTRRTDKDVPSSVSRVLYAELYNQDGYLVERQLVEMRDGRGHGNFVLADTLYGGYYELRAYTRWQLNWGQRQHPHTEYAEKWFFNKAMAREYYRDYDKLYSRVFPVYSKPKVAGEFYHDMTVRPLRRTYKEEDKSGLRLSCYPEGGRLVGGAPCRLAFEAATEEGEWQEGSLRITAANGAAVAEGQTVSRGRGTVTFTPEPGAAYTALFTNKDGRTAKAEVKRVAADGVALSVERQADEWVVSVSPRGAAVGQALGLTLMHEGKVEHFEPLEVADGTATRRFPADQLPAGVNQATVFDAQGRVWADRLFFVTKPALAQPSLTVSGIRPEYQPYEQASLQIECPTAPSAADGATLSLAVRDAGTQDYTFDNGNILTEMLLASEIKGFVPDAAYFFERDDDEHRAALDLLMMTQGWRRFDWHTMATPGAFTLSHPAEYTQVLSGVAHKYTGSTKEDEIRDKDLADHQKFMEADAQDLQSQWDAMDAAADNQLETSNEEAFNQLLESTRSYQVREGQHRVTGDMAAARFYEDEGRLKHEVLVHAEFVQPGSKEGIVGDAVTQKGRFRMQVPDFEGYCLLYLGASDTTQWREGERHMWVSMDEEEYPEFYVRLSFPYPRFVKPYDYYHTQYAPTPEGVTQALDFIPEDGTMMNAVTVQARRRGLRAFDASKPAFVIDAYEAFNEAVDAGLSVAWFQGHERFMTDIARTYIGDMNMERTYPMEARYNSKNSTFYHSPSVINEYNYLYNLDKVYVYTDYSPRREGSTAFSQDNQPTVTIDLRRPDDQGKRVTYRDRRYVLQGFNVADDFYHPDYSRRPLPDGQKDYRRTLYWNPDLRLDGEGKAAVSFFMGSKPASLAVEANGQAADGTLLRN